MARAGSRILDTGDTFPELTVQTVAHGQVKLPHALGDSWKILLLYRAYW